MEDNGVSALSTNVSQWLIENSFRSLSLSTIFFLLEEVIPYLPLISTLLGLIGFLGNTITFLQPELRTKTCCIYIFSSSITDLIHLLINVFPDYLVTKHRYPVPWHRTLDLCRLYLFLYNFLPHLAINFLTLSIIDQFACTCQINSVIRRLTQLKMVPWTILTAIIISALLSSYGPILASRAATSCSYNHPKLYGILNIGMNGILQPMIMLAFAALTYYNVHRSRKRVVPLVLSNPSRFRNQFIVMVITQVIVTAILSLQWMIGQTYALFNFEQISTLEDLLRLLLVLSFTAALYALNNVKSFYFSMMTSRHYRHVFFKGGKRIFSVY